MSFAESMRGLRREVEIRQPFACRELCESQIEFDSFAMAFGQFAVEESPRKWV